MSVLAISGGSIGVVQNLSVGNSPGGMAYLPDGSRFYVITLQNQSVQAFSASTYQPLGSPVALGGAQVDAVAVSGGTNPLLLVSTEDSNGAGTVNVLDAMTMSSLGQMAVGSGPRAMAASPAGDRLYVSCELDSTLWTLDLTSNPVSVLSHMSVGSAPLGVGVSSDGSMVVVVCHFDNTVWVLDAQNTPMTLIGSPVGVGDMPWGVAVFGDQAFVANMNAGNVQIVNLAANPPAVIGAPIPTGGTPTNIAVTNDGLWLLAVLVFGFAALNRQQYQSSVTLEAGQLYD